MRDFIDIWLGLTCWILIFLEVLSERTMNSKIYLTICKFTLLLYLICIVFYGIFSNAQDVILFILSHIFFLGTMTSLFFMHKAFDDKANKNKVILFTSICGIFIVALLLTPWSR